MNRFSATARADRARQAHLLELALAFETAAERLRMFAKENGLWINMTQTVNVVAGAPAEGDSEYRGWEDSWESSDC